MAATITFYPLGNADCTRIDLPDGRKVLVDFGNEGNVGSIDLEGALRNDLKAAGRSWFDAVLFTHLDRDHTCGASEFFEFDHAAAYQGAGRVKIKELWVPAAGLFETGLGDCSRVIRQEARHRLKNGYGIRVFSRPDALRWFLEDNKLTLESRKQLIVDAGGTVPGFSLNGPERAEFFVHCPFAWRQNEREVVDRNQDSVVFQAGFADGSITRFAIFASDIKSETISDIVKSTQRHRREHRLVWDLFKIPHHCSYTALSADKGTTQTRPDAEVSWLFESCARPGAVMVSTSEPIPAGYQNDQPPHRQAANYYTWIAQRIGGQFKVTMECSALQNPSPCHVVIDAGGARFAQGEPARLGLLKPAAATVGAFSFPNRPVAPTKPSGFA